MKLKQLFFAITLAISTNAAQAVVDITAPITTIQGGSKARATWYAPQGTYKVLVYVPDTATATNAIYRLYPKGKNPNSAVCSATEVNYPCFRIAINQALNKNKSVQLMVNNNVDTTWDFTGGQSYVTVASNSLSTTENLGVSGVHFVTQIQVNWGKAISAVAATKLAISECLNDHNGAYNSCDSITELGQYGIITLPTLTNGVVSIVASTAAVQIAGDATLGGCTFQFQPTVNISAGTITWQPKATAAVAPTASDHVADCVQYVKGATY